MFSSTQDNERIIPRKRFNIFNSLLQGFIFLIVLIFIVGPLAAVYIPDLGGVMDGLMQILDGNSFYLFFIVMLLLFGGFNLFSRWMQRTRWMALAEILGLQFEQKYLWNSPSLRGTHRAHQIAITETSKRSGRNRVYYTNFVIGLTSPTEHSLQIAKRGLTDFNRPKTGDDEFDKYLTTASSSERLIQRILRTRRLRLGILQLGERSRVRSLALSRDTMAYVEFGKLQDTEYMQAALTFLVELTNTIESMEQFGSFG